MAKPTDDGKREAERDTVLRGQVSQSSGSGAKAAPELAGKQTYQVWFDLGWPESRLRKIIDGIETPFPEGFIHVGNVEAKSLNEAVLTTDSGSLLTSGGDPPWKPWGRNDGVELLVQTGRDSDVGDVVVDPQGVAHRIERDGFAQIDREADAARQPRDSAHRGRFQTERDQEQER